MILAASAKPTLKARITKAERVLWHGSLYSRAAERLRRCAVLRLPLRAAALPVACVLCQGEDLMFACPRSAPVNSLPRTLGRGNLLALPPCSLCDGKLWPSALLCLWLGSSSSRRQAVFEELGVNCTHAKVKGTSLLWCPRRCSRLLSTLTPWAMFNLLPSHFLFFTYAFFRSSP